MCCQGLSEEFLNSFYTKRLKLLGSGGLKKLVGSGKAQFDKWLYVFRHLSCLQDRPQQFQGRIFQKLFDAAEITQCTPEERDAYEESLKYYRDMKNMVDTSKKTEGISEELRKVAKEIKQNEASVEKIMQYTGLPRTEVEAL